MEQAASARAVLFDKTGTITYGEPTVTQLVPLGDESEASLLYHAAAVEQLSSHSIAKAVLTRGRQQFEKLPLPEGFQETVGHGVEGNIDGHHYLIGSPALLKRRGIETPKHDAQGEISHLCGARAGVHWLSGAQ